MRLTRLLRSFPGTASAQLWRRLKRWRERRYPVTDIGGPPRRRLSRGSRFIGQQLIERNLARLGHQERRLAVLCLR